MLTDARLVLIRKFQGDQSQNQFARSLGVDQSTLSLIFAGKRSPDFVLLRLLQRFPESAAEIADALQQPVEAATARREPSQAVPA